MNRPMLQVALDHTDLPSALAAARILAPEVDVLEAGTILCFAEGAGAVAALRAAHPRHVLLADLKAADAGSVLADMVFSRGATWMTVICNAPLATMKSALEVAKRHQGDVQVELYGDWTFELAAEWMRAGLRQVVFHRGRDAQAAGKTWDETDIATIRKLAGMGLEVSVTGGLEPEDVARFRGIPVKCFIAGRSLYGAADPAAAAKAFRAAIEREWP
ncbi:MAG TPA: 3-keto-L-gulonate-6-phosphate decarboxylase UlaD [Rectinemataceae bacterium]|nr:3-keto-L-gulonate-6-phosphate decarboxylase UlaD [Rectinemataceae bacterium]